MKIDLTNKWMNNVDFLASMAHWEGGALIVLVSHLFWGVRGAVIAAISVMAAAAVKEFVYDAIWELPKQTWKDNLLDFSMYAIGVVAAGVVLLIKSKLGA